MANLKRHMRERQFFFIKIHPNQRGNLNYAGSIAQYNRHGN